MFQKFFQLMLCMNMYVAFILCILWIASSKSLDNEVYLYRRWIFSFCTSFPEMKDIFMIIVEFEIRLHYYNPNIFRIINLFYELYCILIETLSIHVFYKTEWKLLSVGGFTVLIESQHSFKLLWLHYCRWLKIDDLMRSCDFSWYG